MSEIGIKDIYIEIKDFHADLRYYLESIEDTVRTMERILRRIDDSAP